MTAREMFEKIGYKCSDGRERYMNNLIFAPCDEPCIYYEQTGEKGKEMIQFCLDRHIIEFEGVFTRTGYPQRVPAPINMAELEAINQQVKELGWKE